MTKGCNLCPRECGAERVKGQIGFCGCKDTLRVARAAPHFWEEPCISGTRGSGTVFFSGCNLRCVFCQNIDLSRKYIGEEISTERLSEIFIELQGQGVHNINLVTPTPWIAEIKNALDMSWERGLYIPTVFNCGGYESAEAIRSLRGYIGVYLPDFKYIDSKLSGELSLASDYPEQAKKALYEMALQRGDVHFNGEGIMTQGVIVRHLVLPGYIENSLETLEYLYTEYGDSIYISIMNQYTPMAGMKGSLARTVTEAEYREVLDFAEKLGIKSGFIQEGGAAKESFIPEWNGVGVRGK